MLKSSSVSSKLIDIVNIYAIHVIAIIVIAIIVIAVIVIVVIIVIAVIIAVIVVSLPSLPIAVIAVIIIAVVAVVAVIVIVVIVIIVVMTMHFGESMRRRRGPEALAGGLGRRPTSCVCVSCPPPPPSDLFRKMPLAHPQQPKIFSGAPPARASSAGLRPILHPAHML